MTLIRILLIVIEHYTFLFFYKPIPISQNLIYTLDSLLDARIKVILDVVVTPAPETSLPQLGAYLRPLLRVLAK